MCPVYVPGVSAPSVAEICRAPGALPLVGETESHDESLLAVKVRLPPPLLVMFTDDAAGLLPPWVALNVSDVGETDSAGVAGTAETTNVAVIVDGLFSAPVAETVTWPV